MGFGEVILLTVISVEVYKSKCNKAQTKDLVKEFSLVVYHIEIQRLDQCSVFNDKNCVCLAGWGAFNNNQKCHSLVVQV